jgi:hypothetical protein
MSETVGNDEAELQVSCRNLLLNFYSSEISTHGRMFIGFAALFFTIIQIKLSLDAMNIILRPIQTIIIYFSVFAIGCAIYYIIFRLICYGVYANATIHATLTELREIMRLPNCVSVITTKIYQYVLKESSKILFFLPVSYFLVPAQQKFGIMISAGFSLATTFLFYLVIH